jgi:multidrug efflux pump subunit AcrA (membrane-fusion protein)
MNPQATAPPSTFNSSPMPPEVMPSGPALPEMLPPLPPETVHAHRTTPEDPLSKRTWRWIWWLVIPLLLSPFLVMNKSRGSSTATAHPQQLQPLPVQTQVLEPVSAYRVQRAYTGEIVARRSSDLGFEQAGTIVELLVEEGDWVEAGAPLARLDTRSLQAQRRQLEAQQRQAYARFQELQRGPRQEDIAAAQAAVQDLQAQLDLARLQQQRRGNLYTQGAISREELDSAKFSAEALTNRLQQAQSQLNELRAGTRIEQVTAQDAQVDQIEASIQNIDVSLSKSVLYAPFSGRIARRVVDEGVVVGTGQPVLRVVEGAALEARIGVPAQIAPLIPNGSPQAIEVEGETVTGTVTALLPELDDTSQTVTIVVSLPTDAQPTIGATARLILQTQQPATGYWLPTSALVAGDRGLWSAYLLTTPEMPVMDNNIFEVARRQVEILYTEGNRAFVRGLLEPGEVVITSGTHRLVPGQLVQK